MLTQSFARLGFSLSVFGLTRLDFPMSVLDFIHFDLAASLQTLV